MALQSALASTRSIGHILLVEIKVDEWRTSNVGAYSLNYYRLADKVGTITVPDLGGNLYYGLGQLMSVSSSSSEIRPSSNEVTISLSGLTNSALQEFINSKIKGSRVKIHRGIFINSSNTIGSTIPSGVVGGINPNPILRFQGYVNNIQFDEEWDSDTRTSKNTIILNCASTVDIMQNKISGRRTNPESHKKFFPSDISMDRVPNLETAFFDFGAKK